MASSLDGNSASTNSAHCAATFTSSSAISNRPVLQHANVPNNPIKYGTVVPNRIFVGGIALSTTEAELLQLFSNYGVAKSAKIIKDKSGISKGYGFVTFESEDEVKQLQLHADIVMRDRKLNIAPAIKKQPLNRPYEVPHSPSMAPDAPSSYLIPSGGIPLYQNEMGYYPPPPPPPADPVLPHNNMYRPPDMYPSQPTPSQATGYPLVYSTQPMYIPQQYHCPPVLYDNYYCYYPIGGTQFMMASQNVPHPQGYSMPQCDSMPRTPYYNSPVSYNPETMYVNMPVYGGFLETISANPDYWDMSNWNVNQPSDTKSNFKPHYHESKPVTSDRIPSSTASLHFAPPERRRDRRYVQPRLSTLTPNEVGAGDARPSSPSSDISDSRQMLDNLHF